MRGFAIWQYAPLQPDAAMLENGWPAIPDRLERAAAFAAGYRLDDAGRRAVPAMIAQIIDQCAAAITMKARAGQVAFERLVQAGVLDHHYREARYVRGMVGAVRRRLCQPAPGEMNRS